MTTGKKIRQFRRQAGLTQCELAEMLNVRPETLSRVESGRGKCSERLLQMIADALTIKPEMLEGDQR